MMIGKRIHHIGIILPSEEAVQAFMEQYGLTAAGAGETPYLARCIFTQAKGEESPIEFLIPRGGPLQAFNNGKGGIHHICYEVENIEQAQEELQARGCKMLEEKAIMAEDGSKVNFVRPGSSFGILVELMQPSATLKQR